MNSKLLSALILTPVVLCAALVLVWPALAKVMLVVLLVPLLAVTWWVLAEVIDSERERSKLNRRVP